MRTMGEINGVAPGHDGGGWAWGGGQADGILLAPGADGLYARCRVGIGAPLERIEVFRPDDEPAGGASWTRMVAGDEFTVTAPQRVVIRPTRTDGAGFRVEEWGPPALVAQLDAHIAVKNPNRYRA